MMHAPNYYLTRRPSSSRDLFVACETVLPDKPLMVTTFWKVIGISNPYGSPVPLTETSDLTMLDRGSFHGIRSITYFIDPKATQDVLQVTEDVPCPRRRYKEKRWFNGRWQGLSNKGWIDL